MWDFLSGAWDTIGGWDTIGKVGSVAGAGYDIYKGVQSQKASDRYADIAFANAEEQNEYARAMLERQQALYWPLEELQVGYTMEDMQALRPMYQQQIGYANERGMADLAVNRELDPLLDQTKKSLVRKLVEGEDVIRDRLMGQASTDVTAGYAQQREEDTRRMGIAGINPNSGASQNYMNRMGTNQALSESMARTQASRQAEDIALSRQAQALNYRAGAQLPQYQVTPSVTSAGIMSGLGGAGGATQGLANMYDNSAQNSWKGASYLLQGLKTQQKG